MEAAAFLANAPGQLVSIGGGESAFVPDPLPPRWKFPERLWPLLADARQWLGTLDGSARRLPAPDLLLKPLQQREALRSSSLEGTYATPRELLLFEMEPQTHVADENRVQAWREVSNYSRALRLERDGEQPLGLHLIRQLHAVLMDGVRGGGQSPGAFRSGQVHIGHDRRFVPPPPTHVQSCLEQLQQYMAAEDTLNDPLVRCYLAHYQFETIHPFLDGNGRVGRLLLAVMIRDFCKLAGPWLYMSAYFDRHRDEYIDRLFAVSTQSAWENWIEFCLYGTREQAKDTLARCESLLRARDDFQKRLPPKGSVRLAQLVDGLFYSPIVRIADVQRRMRVTYPTAKTDVERLVEVGILEELPGENPRTFVAREVYNIAFSEDGTPAL